MAIGPAGFVLGAIWVQVTFKKYRNLEIVEFLFVSMYCFAENTVFTLVDP